MDLSYENSTNFFCFVAFELSDPLAFHAKAFSYPKVLLCILDCIINSLSTDMMLSNKLASFFSSSYVKRSLSHHKLDDKIISFQRFPQKTWTSEFLHEQNLLIRNYWQKFCCEQKTSSCQAKYSSSNFVLDFCNQWNFFHMLRLFHRLLLLSGCKFQFRKRRKLDFPSFECAKFHSSPITLTIKM